MCAADLLYLPLRSALTERLAHPSEPTKFLSPSVLLPLLMMKDSRDVNLGMWRSDQHVVQCCMTSQRDRSGTKRLVKFILGILTAALRAKRNGSQIEQ